MIDVFVDSLDLATLGFDGVKPAQTGRLGARHGCVKLFYVVSNFFNLCQQFLFVDM